MLAYHILNELVSCLMSSQISGGISHTESGEPLHCNLDVLNCCLLEFQLEDLVIFLMALFAFMQVLHVFTNF